MNKKELINEIKTNYLMVEKNNIEFDSLLNETINNLLSNIDNKSEFIEFLQDQLIHGLDDTDIHQLNSKDDINIFFRKYSIELIEYFNLRGLKIYILEIEKIVYNFYTDIINIILDIDDLKKYYY